jgi:lipoprotein-releasing system permease protein
MLGVATLIVVNSVMSGFSTKLRDRLHGLLSDVVMESMMHDGFDNPEQKIRRIWRSPIADKIEAITPTIEKLGLIQMTYQGEAMPPRPARLIGIDPKGRTKLGGFAEYLIDSRNRQEPSFDLRPEARQRHDEQFPSVPPEQLPLVPPKPGEPPLPWQPPAEEKVPAGIFLGYSIGHYRRNDITLDSQEKDVAVLRPGDEVILFSVSGQRMTPVYDRVVVADFFKSEMSEYDANYIFVPIEWFQRLLGMENRASSLQIKLKDYRDAPAVVSCLQQLFPHEAGYHVETWEQKQGPLLAAISIERSILNILLFLIIGVAGFGILAIFSMIVVEKTRDIGILKALGASNIGVMKIFLGYGLLLGIVGATLGTALGMGITAHINEIERVLAHVTGQQIFDRKIYYFNEIPTDIQAWTVGLINAGAVLIAVLFSVLPAFRAALLHPVRALRYE